MGRLDQACKASERPLLGISLLHPGKRKASKRFQAEARWGCPMKGRGKVNRPTF